MKKVIFFQSIHPNRIALAVLFSFLIGSVGLVAQTVTAAFSTVSPYTGLTTDQNRVLSYATAQPQIGTLQHVAWGTGPLFDNNGMMTVSLPGENFDQPISFKLRDADFTDPTHYALYGSSSLGEIALYVTPEGIGGSITLASSVNSYALYPLGGTKGVLIKRNSSIVETGSCGSDLIPSPEPPLPPSYCNTDCGPGVLDVLAMVTPPAQQWLNTNFGLFGLWFLFVECNNINGAFANSGVIKKRVRVQIVAYTPTFALTSNISTDINNLTNNVNAQQTLQQSGADVGILLTNQNYGSTFGITNSLNPASTNKFCIAQVAFIDPIRFTFAHELAHQIGCRHHNDFSDPNCPHGKQLTTIGKNTIMVGGVANNTRIQHFSNPDIFFGGESTGTVGTRNNAAQIRGAFCEVANNNSPVLFASSFIVTSDVASDCPFSANAIVQAGMQEINGLLWNCGTTYTYQWSWSANNTTYTNFGTNSATLNLSAAPNCPLFFLRLTVTTPMGCSASHTALVFCSGVQCRSDNPDELVSVEKNRIFPNPAQDRINVALEGFAEIGTVTAASTNGSEVYSLRVLNYDQGLLSCDVSNLPSGMWFVAIQGKDKKQVFKLAIAR